MRYLYTILFYLILPFAFLRLLWRSRKVPDYRKRWGERLGFYPVKLDKCIWVHAVSVGETIAAIPLIKALQKQYPALLMVVTTMTPTGAQRVKAALGDTVTHVYLPYDLPGAVNRFLNAIHPVVGVIMETELWPNLIATCHARKIPLCLMNARLSEKSARGYQRVALLTRAMLQQLTVIAAHGKVDAERFIALGAPAQKVVVTGNLKFDLQLAPDLLDKAHALRAQLGNDRFIWIAASTHEGEEEIILAAHQQLRAKIPTALLILVPRHPDRFDAIAKLCAQQFATVRRSEQKLQTDDAEGVNQSSTCTQDTAVYLGDTMGEMMLMYAASDVAFVGGSLITRGGHNILEPGALGKPILSGPHVFNFKEICEMFVKGDALVTVNNADQLAQQIIHLAQDAQARAALGARGLQILNANRGALQKQLDVIGKVITSN